MKKVQIDYHITIDSIMTLIISLILNIFRFINPHSILCQILFKIFYYFISIKVIYYFFKSGITIIILNNKSNRRKSKPNEYDHELNIRLKAKKCVLKFCVYFIIAIFFTLIYKGIDAYNTFSNIDFQETAKYTHENIIKWMNKECEPSDVIVIVKKDDSSQDAIKKTNSETVPSSQDNIGKNEKKDLKQDDDISPSKSSSPKRFIQGNARFYLENVNEVKTIDTTSNEFKEIFAAQNGLIQSDITVEYLQMYLQQVIDQKIIEKKEDGLASMGTSEDYELINKLSEDELTFFQQCNTAASDYKTTGDISTFINNLPSSSFFESINQQRLNMIQAGKGNYGLSCLVSNWNQTFALEYQNQNGSGDTILYYYIQSIMMDFECLSYEACSIQEQYIIMKKIEARYSDICACESIKQEYRDRAQLLQSAMTNICNEFYYEHPEYWDTWTSN